jgi:cytochrome c biogenesis protein
MFKKLGSVKITIVLLVLLVASSIMGTLVPQGFTDHQYRAKYGDGLYSFMKNLQLLDVYHSYWYTALLAIFCIHLIICSTLNLKPLINILTRTNHITDSIELNEKKVYQEFSLRSKTKQGKSNDVSQQIKDIFKRSFYKLKQFDESKGIYYFEKGKIGRIGPLITHASIVIILIGGMLVGRLGFRDYMNIPIGKTMDVPRTSFQIRADDFKAEFYPNSQTPKAYISKLTIIENEVEKITKSI